MAHRSDQLDFRLKRRPNRANIPILEKLMAYSLRELGEYLQTADNVYNEINNLAQMPCVNFTSVYNIQPSDYVPERGRFAMMYTEQCSKIRKRIAGGRLKGACSLLWLICIEKADQDTGEVQLDRDELAAEAGYTVHQTTKAMKLLDEYGAVWTFRKKGRAVYRCNPIVGWNGRRESELQKSAWWMHEETQRRALALIKQPELELPEPEESQRQARG